MSSGCATDVLLLHTAWTQQKTNMPYLHTNIHLKADLGGEDKSYIKDTSTVLKKNDFQVQARHPARPHFCPSPIFLCRDSQPAVLSSITGGLDRTAPPWLPRLYCYCGRMNGAGIETKTRREGYEAPPSDSRAERASQAAADSQSTGTGRENNFSE